MTAWPRRIDALLRGANPAEVPARELAAWVGWLCLGGCCYGAVMGLYGGVSGGRALQVLYSTVKVPLLLWVTFFLTLPSFFVLNTLLGLRPDFPEVFRALLRTQSVSAIILAAFAPYTALWYVTSADYNEAILFNAVMFGAASLSAQVLLWRAYRPLVERNPRHRFLLRGWIGAYAFVGVQMGWVLRPFIGDPRAATRFFREGAWSNAYVAVAELIVSVWRGWWE